MVTQNIVQTPSLKIDQAFKLAAPVGTTPAMIRMTSLDCNYQLKLNALWELTFATYQDVLRERCDISALNGRGIYEQTEYVELKVRSEPLFPQRAQLQTAVCAGPLQASTDGYALLGSASLEAAPAGETRDASECGRMRILSRLIRRHAPHDQRAVGTLPFEMSALKRIAPTELPIIASLSSKSELVHAVGVAELEQTSCFAHHETDAHLLVDAGAYMSMAQSWAHVCAMKAGLPMMSGVRVRASFKRAFSAGQPYTLRCRTYCNADASAAHAVVQFRSLRSDGSADPRPAVLVSIESEAPSSGGGWS